MLSNRKPRSTLFLIVLIVTLGSSFALGEDLKTSGSPEKKIFSLPDDTDASMIREASKVRDDLYRKVGSLFTPKSLGWTWETVSNLYPEYVGEILQQRGKLVFFGSIFLVLFVAALFSLFWVEQFILVGFEERMRPVGNLVPAANYPLYRAALAVMVSAFIPLIFLGICAFLGAMQLLPDPWLRMTARLLGLWTGGAIVYRVVETRFNRGIFTLDRSSERLSRWIKLVLLFALVMMGFFWIAEAFPVRADVLALIKTAVSLAIIGVVLLLFLNKEHFLSIMPDLPYRSYQGLRRFLTNSYSFLLALSFLTAVMWTFGYVVLGELVLVKMWGTIFLFLCIMALYHGLTVWLKRWDAKLDPADETAQHFATALHSTLLYATIVATATILFSVLGLINPLKQMISVPLFKVGGEQVTLFTIIVAVLILLGFSLLSRLLQAYLDFKIYPLLGIDQGLGYALNTCLKYIILVIGILISLKLVGINLQFLLVFAGAIGIGIGLGMQNIAMNVISGFTIIFGGKIRRGDWIEIEGRLGTVTDIYLRATKVQTREKVEYLIPNSDLITKTIINYSLSSPMIRMSIPVGVSYRSDPRTVERILLEVAKREPLVSDYQEPVVAFAEYADSSLNFELLIWINVRDVPRRKVRSALYFAIFDEFKKQGIEIPFPQRDVHIRSTVQ